VSAPGLFALRLDDDLAIALYERRHVDRLFALVQRNREHLGRFMVWAVDPKIEDTAAFIERSLAEFARGEGFQGGLWYRGELIGGIGTPNFDRHDHRTEIGYWLGTEAEGKGLMGRAVIQLIRHLFTAEEMNRIEIRAQVDNHRSRAIPERLGFTQEGTLRQQVYEGGAWRDHVVYSLLRSEWQQRQEEA
jgi:ribosomal-protein-serine acetyltransferase